MGDLIRFVPRPELDASENLQGFIASCRDQLTIFGRDLPWDAMTWVVTDAVTIRGRKGRSAFVFSNFDTAGLKRMALPMSSPYIDFAKAYMRFQHAGRRTNAFTSRLAALRALEKALVETSVDGVARVELTDPHVLNRATQLVQQKFLGSSYQVANQLEIIGDFLVKNTLTAIPFVWKNPLEKPDDDCIRIGKKAARRRAAKMPSKESLDALAHAFHTAVHPVDIIPTSIAALLMCAPSRINEVFRLPVNCEYTRENEYAIRWWPAKGAEPMLKPIPSTMVDTAQKAIQRLLQCSEEARRMAAWYESNPGALYLPPHLEHTRRSKQLTAEDLCQIIGFSKPKFAINWAKLSGLKPMVQNAAKLSHHIFDFKSVEKVIVNMLPKGFPIYDPNSNLKYSEALIIFPKNLFHTGRCTYNCMFECMTTDQFNNQLGSGIKHGRSSLFSRLGFVDEAGSPYTLTSYQFRHYLNTIAQRKKLDQLDIAFYSGRKDIRQNSAYDHRTCEEMLELMKQGDVLPGDKGSCLPRPPIARTKFAAELSELDFPAVHTTQYGYCVHDWSSSPCQRYRACLDCNEHKCLKGDFQKTEKVRECLRDAEEQFAVNEQALVNGTVGADKWLTYNRRRVDRLRNLIQILDDPAVPEGSIIELRNQFEYSPIEIAVNKRRQLGDAGAILLNEVAALAIENSAFLSES